MDVTIEDARNRLDQLLDLAAGGTEVAVIRDGKPRVLLVPAGQIAAVPKLQGPALRAAIDEIVASVKLMDIPPAQRTSNHDDMYDEFGAPK